jgi:hypothetical protein
MSVITYLQGRASTAVLSGYEEKSINTSISTIKTRLTSHFGTGLSDQFRFGSSTRGTILPRIVSKALCCFVNVRDGLHGQQRWELRHVPRITDSRSR